MPRADPVIEPLIPAQLWDRYPIAHRPTRPPDWLGNAGGLSGSDLWRVAASAGDLVLRAWPANGPAPASLNQIHAWLDRLRPLGYVAVPLPGAIGSTWFAASGRAWELSRWLPGLADLAQPPSSSHLATMFRTLATVHEALVHESSQGPSPGMAARRDELERLLSVEFQSLRLALDRSEPDPPRWLAERWLALAQAVAPLVIARLRPAAEWVVDQQPCLRDVRPDHFLFQGDQLTGLVDFGAMGCDAVATDLARLLGETVGQDAPRRQVALAAYQAVRPLRATDAALMAAFEAANAVLGPARWVRWHFVDRREFAGSSRVTDGLIRTLARLEAWAAVHR